MTLQPPPYTRHCTNIEAQAIESRKLRLHRFLIDSVAFAYDVDYAQLRNALTFSELLRKMEENHLEENLQLSQHDSDNLLHVATIVQSTIAQVDKVRVTSPRSNETRQYSRYYC